MSLSKTAREVVQYFLIGAVVLGGAMVFASWLGLVARLLVWAFLGGWDFIS